VVFRNGQLSKLCYYGETLVTKGSLLELWYSGSELQLALFPESNGSLVSATSVPRDSCRIGGTNSGNHPGPTPVFFKHGSKPYKWKPGSHTMDFPHIQTYSIAIIQFYRLHTALLLIVECTCRAIRVVVCSSAYSYIV
jgi:hypothetical protein